MTEAAPKSARKPGAGLVLWSSLALFAVLLAVLALQLGAGTAGSTQAKAPTLVRKVVKRRIVTTIVPTPGPSSVSAGPALTAESGSSAPITTASS